MSGFIKKENEVRITNKSQVENEAVQIIKGLKLIADVPTCSI